MRASLRDARFHRRAALGAVVTVLAIAALAGTGQAGLNLKGALKQGASQAAKRGLSRAVGAAAAGAAGTTAAKAEAQAPAKASAGTPAAVPASSAQRLTVNPAPRRTAPAQPQLEEGPQYHYNAIGRRDPFAALVGGEFVDIDAPPDLGGLKVVGIVWGAEDRFALVEDVRGNSFVLRTGDKLMNGVVQGLRRDALIASITADGQTQTVTIPLTRKGDSNANR